MATFKKKKKKKKYIYIYKLKIQENAYIFGKYKLNHPRLKKDSLIFILSPSRSAHSLVFSVVCFFTCISAAERWRVSLKLGLPGPSAPLPRAPPTAARWAAGPQTRPVLLTHSVACFSFENMDGIWCSDGGSFRAEPIVDKNACVHLSVCQTVSVARSCARVYVFEGRFLPFSKYIWISGKQSCSGQFIEHLLKKIHTSQQTKCWTILITEIFPKLLDS